MTEADASGNAQERSQVLPRKENNMWTGKWELVLITVDGEEIYEYSTFEETEEAQRGMKMVLGNQLLWAGIREQMA